MDPVYSSGNLEIYVEEKPIGGYRGQTGTLKIEHKQKLIFTDWQPEDLEDLAKMTEKVLIIHEKSQITNTLIYGKQHQGTFTVQFIPYPKCNFYEKVQGAYHVVCGGSSLTPNQIKEIQKFYSSEQFERPLEDTLDEGEPDEQEPLTKNVKGDVFCQEDRLKKQRIANVYYEERKYHILHDNRPKVAHKSDPHFLIIPDGEAGHVDGSSVPLETRLDMLQEVQKAMKIFLEKESHTLLYLERNGVKLQGIHHKSSHASGIGHFPETFFEKCMALIGLAWPRKLSDAEMNSRIDKYGTYYKPKID